MQEIYRMLARLMQTDLTVTITGESGTGKELVARALHDYGKRRKGPFVAVNMAAIPRELIESELFGHERGAFTGAQNRSAGRFEQAEGGTLFLTRSATCRWKRRPGLLRVLQQGEYTTVGGRTPIRTEVRICRRYQQGPAPADRQACSGRPVLPLERGADPLPPLRERADDIPRSGRHFLRRAEREGSRPRHRSRAHRGDAALSLARQHSRAGEPRPALPRAYPQERYQRGDGGKRDRPRPAGPASRCGGATTSAAPWSATSPVISATTGAICRPPGLYQRILKEVEGPVDQRRPRAHSRATDQAAELLGLNRNTLRKKIRDLDLHVMRRGV
jgi:two-component system nitrogen regulation response regulator GlnG